MKKRIVLLFSLFFLIGFVPCTRAEETEEATEDGASAEEVLSSGAGRQGEDDEFRSAREKPKRRPKAREIDYGLLLRLGGGWEDNVFHSTDIFTDTDAEEDDALFFTGLDTFVDVPVGETWTWENEFAASLEEYDVLDDANVRKAELESEIHYEPSSDWELFLGGQAMRRVGKETYHFPREHFSDDYYRYDVYPGFEKRLGPSDWISGYYRYVLKDYDELRRLPSDDYDEHRFRLRWKHRYSKTVRSYLYTEARYRFYDEKFARDQTGSSVPSEARELEKYFAGCNLYWNFVKRSLLRFGVEGIFVNDPFEDYYSYDGYALEAGLEQPLPWNFYFSTEGSFEDRDYDHRRFLEIAGDPPVDKYQIYELECVIGYKISRNYCVELLYEGEWLETNQAEATHDVHRVALQFEIRI